MADAARDDARREVATRGLTPVAVTHLTRDALGTIDFAQLGPVKQLLKRFFSDQPWTAADDDVLAALVGSGTGWWRHTLDDDFSLEFGWRAGAFRIELPARAVRGAMFAGPVVPEATPNPRTIRFVTPKVHDGPSRWYAAAADSDDARVTRVFTEFDDVANVLVGPDFVAVGIHHPDRWEQLLDPMLLVITDEFAPAHAAPESETLGAPDAEADRGAAHAGTDKDRGGALEQAWKELGSLRASAPGDLDRILAAAASPNRAARQVAARLLAEADEAVAEGVWDRLLDDPSRSVRRAAVDAMVDTERPELRALLERALGDADPWTR